MSENEPDYLRNEELVDRNQLITRRPTSEPISKPVHYSSFLCGLLAGVAQAGIFNPYDRALYLSVKNHRHFLSWKNWQSPYTGFFQTIGGRALSGGLYFPLEHFFLHLLDPKESNPRYNFIAGTAAGAINAFILNPLSAVKYKTWGREKNRGAAREAWAMLAKSGSFRPFFNGLLPTIYRDVVFGGCYTWMRLQLHYWLDLESHEQWKANLVAASLATIASGPFNYVRNIQYATSARVQADSTAEILRQLISQARAHSHWRDALLFLQKRLRIGWGTLRVALGITFGHAVYDWLHHTITPYY